MSDRRVFTGELKREAVRLAKESGNLSATARDLGVHMSVLQHWKKALTTDKPNPFPGQGNPSDPELARLQRENARLQEEIEILKGCRYLHQSLAVRYHFVQEHQLNFSIAALCRVMQVSVSGYYAWKKRLPSPQEQANQQLLEQIEMVYKDSDQTYGSPRIYTDLKEAGIACSEKHIARLMHLA